MAKKIEKENKKLEVQTLGKVDVENLTNHAFIGDAFQLDEGLAFGTAWQTPFTIRTTRPLASDKNAKCYINYETGGWSGAIVCSSDAINTLPNCVGYANGRFNEIYNEMKGTTGSKFPWFNCNACNFIARRNEMYPDLEVGSDPVPGAIIVWTGGWGDYGHVAIVERINPDGSIFTSESAYGGSFFYTATRYPANQWGMGGTYKFAGFIYNPAVPKIAPEPTPDTDRDEKKNQLICEISDLRIRTSPSLASDDNILDLLPQDCYYNYSEVKLADNYEWFKIANNQWCARVDENAPRILPYDLFPTKFKVNCTKYKEGVIEVDKEQACGYDPVNVNVKCNKGYACTKLMVNGKEIKDFFKMPRIGEVTLTAEFKKVSYTITCEETNNGYVETDLTDAEVGETVCVKVHPDNGYRLSKLYSEQVVIESNTFKMPDKDVIIFAEFEEVHEPKFKVGDRVRILKVGNSKSDGSGYTVFHIGGEYTIINVVWGANFSLVKFPYQLGSWTGSSLGYFAEDDLEFIREVPIEPQELYVGDQVKIKARGNSKPDGTGSPTFGIGWKKEIMAYIEDATYPYKVGKNGVVQGYYKAKDLKRV